MHLVPDVRQSDETSLGLRASPLLWSSSKPLLAGGPLLQPAPVPLALRF